MRLCQIPRFHSVFLVAELVVKCLGNFLVAKGPWLTLFIGNVFMLLVTDALTHADVYRNCACEPVAIDKQSR